MAALGVARANDAELLSEAGANFVVTTLDDVELDALLDGGAASLHVAGPPPGVGYRASGSTAVIAAWAAATRAIGRRNGERLTRSSPAHVGSS
jgi:hypothetical protein